MKPIKIYQIHAFNLGGNYGRPLEKGCMAVLTNIEPEFTYEKVGRFYMAEHDGFVHCYENVLGTKDGFAGREIRLWVKGGVVFKNLGRHVEIFNGSLWDSDAAYRKYEEIHNTKVFCVGQKSISGFSKCAVFQNCYVNRVRMKEIVNHLKFSQATLKIIEQHADAETN